MITESKTQFKKKQSLFDTFVFIKSCCKVNRVIWNKSNQEDLYTENIRLIHWSVKHFVDYNLIFFVITGRRKVG